ncbi:rhodanese-like domain-containing protein [Shewanella gaetbuli]|uniref:Sulfurtransferase n=1 Tax=Shewanella gaetbuli TaxID=220752 RepID=A0A9X1ZH19_9GAMM|nr:rhodanese-like domain-containing protein [Shewanella gaetbuli]MCL1141593.1 sulfurtransferase [Shewanella gaetbuli]
MQANSAFAQLVGSVKDKVTPISIGEFQQQDHWQLVDVREDSEWLQGHLPNAKHVSKGMIECEIESRFPDKASPVLLYCGAGPRSILAAYNLQLMGYTQVAWLEGGFKAWLQHQFPVVKD